MLLFLQQENSIKGKLNQNGQRKGKETKEDAGNKKSSQGDPKTAPAENQQIWEPQSVIAKILDQNSPVAHCKQTSPSERHISTTRFRSPTTNKILSLSNPRSISRLTTVSVNIEDRDFLCNSGARAGFLLRRETVPLFGATPQVFVMSVDTRNSGAV